MHKYVLEIFKFFKNFIHFFNSVNILMTEVALNYFNRFLCYYTIENNTLVEINEEIT